MTRRGRSAVAKSRPAGAGIVEGGPIAAIHGVVRWRACDLIMRLYEEFGLSVSDDTIYRALKKLGFSHMSARPKANKQNAEAMEAFKKNFAERVAEIRAQLARPARPNSTAKKISGNLCGRTGCRTEFSNPSMTSSITAATPGTRSSISRGKSCPSRAAIGQPQITQSEDWYKPSKTHIHGLCDKHHLRWKKTNNTDGESVMAQSPQQPQQSPHERFKKFPLVHHHEVQETFVDQLGLFTFDGGTLRMELAVARMNEPKPPAQPTGERHIVARLVMSAPCAIDLINQMQLIAAQLAQAGLIKMERPPTSVQPTEKAN